MAEQSYSTNYSLFNNFSVKNLNVVVCIEGLDVCFSLVATYKRVHYGDPGVLYGDPGLVYGGLVLDSTVQPLLSIESSLMLSQKVEPEQGRGSVSTLSLTFIDKDGYFSKLCSPGIILDELLANKKVTVKLGYIQTSYPDDYFTIFRGYITKTRLQPAKVTFELSDPSSKRRQYVFFSQKTTLTSAINSSTLTIPVATTERFFDHILGPDGTYDPAIRTFLQIEDELIEYGPGDVLPTSVTATARGALFTTAAAHDSGTDVQTVVQIEDHLIDMALKVMLSGWNGYWLTDVSVASIVQTNDPDQGLVSNAFVIDEDNVDTNGLAIGDYFNISGSTMGNDGVGRITSIGAQNDLPNRIIFTDKTFTVESPATGVAVSFRSQYDTYPVECGLQLLASDVDVQRHVDIKNNFLSQSENTMRFLLNDQETGKEFIENQIFLPPGLYAITRFGKMSVAITKPPIADERLSILNTDSVLSPENIQIERATNTRRFYNEIQYNYNEQQLQKDAYGSVEIKLDTDSLIRFDQVSTLPVKARGLRTDLNAETLIDRRGSFILSRYKNAAYEITMSVNWKAGSIIEAGDVVAIQDDGGLKIANLLTGVRDLGTQLFEVIERNMDIKSGIVQLKLLSNLGYLVTDRFATISPSSIVGSGSTSTKIVLTPSYGEAFGSDEYKKYIDFIGLPVVVHDYNWTYEFSGTIVGFQSGSPNNMVVSDLGYTPIAGDIVDIAMYPDTTDPLDNQAYKQIFEFIDPTLSVVTGTSPTVFDVSAPDAAKAVVGQAVFLHNEDYSIYSPEVNVLSIVGTTITVDSSLGFTPDNTFKVELVGFHDGGGPYRII